MVFVYLSIKKNLYSSGNMWAQTWTNIESFTRPYPDKKETDITQAMKNQVNIKVKLLAINPDFARFHHK